MDLLQFQHHFTFYYCQLSFIFAVMTPKYKRILLKLSGEALMGEQNFGIDPARLQQYAADIKEVSDAGVQVAIVIDDVERPLGADCHRLWHAAGRCQPVRVGHAGARISA